MNEYMLEVKSTLKVTAQDIGDILVTAFEGGINYWCNSVQYANAAHQGGDAVGYILNGGSLKLYDAESEDVWLLTLDKLLNGIKQAYEHNLYTDYEWVVNNELDTCNIDADVADCIIQYALFNDIVFG